MGPISRLLAAALALSHAVPKGSAKTQNGRITPVPSTSVVIEIETGLLRGHWNSSLAAYQFLGIPYATPPVGARRWQPPKPPSTWAPSIRDANVPGASCPQRKMTSPTTSEDCLTMAVWTPPEAVAQTKTGLPVMVYFHGGCERGSKH